MPAAFADTLRIQIHRSRTNLDFFTAITVQPAHSNGVNGNQETFFVNTHSGTGSSAHLWTIGGTRDLSVSPTLTTTEETGLTSHNSIGEAVDQPDTVADIDGGDARVLNAVYWNRRVFATMTNDVDNNGSRSATHASSLTIA